MNFLIITSTWKGRERESVKLHMLWWNVCWNSNKVKQNILHVVTNFEKLFRFFGVKNMENFHKLFFWAFCQLYSIDKLQKRQITKAKKWKPCSFFSPTSTTIKYHGHEETKKGKCWENEKKEEKGGKWKTIKKCFSE